MKCIALLAVAGLATVATVASAQGDNVVASDFVFSITWSDNDIQIGEFSTATLTASWVGEPTSYLSSVNIDLLADNEIVNAFDTALVSWNVPILGFDGIGQASGASILTLDAAQFHLFFPPVVGNPFLITTFEVQAVSLGELNYSFTTSPLGTEAAATISNPPQVTANPKQFGGPGDTPAGSNFETLRVVPAPSAMALLGLGGLVATRRRR
jgi:hypothetical protein